MRIGVLAMQGAFAEHIAMLHHLGIEALPVRLPSDLKYLDGLIIPGGESTTISYLMSSYNISGEVKRLAQAGLPVMGTCAGMILMAREVTDPDVEPLGLMDITVERNAFGRQRESFETELSIPVLGKGPFRGIFIRAPLIERINGKTEVITRLADGTIVAAREDKLLAAAFHPELAGDPRFHQYFLNIIDENRKS